MLITSICSILPRKNVPKYKFGNFIEKNALFHDIEQMFFLSNKKIPFLKKEDFLLNLL